MILKLLRSLANKQISLNLSYKTGRNLTYENKDVIVVPKNQENIHPPSHINMTSSLIYLKNEKFFLHIKTVTTTMLLTLWIPINIAVSD